MKHIATRLLLTATLVASCSTDTDVTDRPLFPNGVNVFEAQVIDGLTGARVANAEVAVQVGRHILDAANDDGFYTVYGIPYGSFRVMVSAPGYVDFRAMVDFTGNGKATDGVYSYTFNNILIYPTGNIPDDIVVSVYDGNDGSPVPDATVVASLTGITGFVTVDDPLAPGVGLLPSTIAAHTDASGKAVLPASSLVMGGTYSINVFGALDQNGVFLVPEQNETVKVGFTVQEVVTFLTRPVLRPVAVSANNEDRAVAVGFLEVNFPYPIEICSAAQSQSWSNTTSAHSPNTFALDHNDSDGDTTVTSPATSSDPVTATLLNDDTTLHLVFNTENDDAGDDLWVTFSGVYVKPLGSEGTNTAGSCHSLGTIGLRDTSISPSSTVNTEIFVRDVAGVP